MSQAVRTARCRTPPTFTTMARSRREIDTTNALDRNRRCDMTPDTTIDVDIRCNREVGVGGGEAQRESLSTLSYEVSIAV